VQIYDRWPQQIFELYVPWLITGKIRSRGVGGNMQYTVIGMRGVVSLMSNGDMEIGWLTLEVQQEKIIMRR